MEIPATDPLVRDEILSILETMPAFQRLDRETLLQLFHAAKLVNFDPGVTLLSQEAAAESFSVILNGTVSIYSERGPNEPVHLGDIVAPTLFLAGNRDSLVPSPRWARFMGERVPESSVTILDGYGHVCLIDHDLDLTEHVVPWWATVRGTVG